MDAGVEEVDGGVVGESEDVFEGLAVPAWLDSVEFACAEDCSKSDL